MSDIVAGDYHFTFAGLPEAAWLPAHNFDLYVPCDCMCDPGCENCGGRGWTEEAA